MVPLKSILNTALWAAGISSANVRVARSLDASISIPEALSSVAVYDIQWV